MKSRSDPVLSMVSIATKAGKVKSGEFSVEKCIKEGTAHCVLIATDASENTVKKFSDLCNYRDIPIYIYGSSDDLGRACGKPFRMSLAISDAGLSEAIISKIKNAAYGG